MNRPVEWAKKIAAIAKTGLFYAKDPFDEDRYQRLVDIAAEMLADIGDSPAQAIKREIREESGYLA